LENISAFPNPSDGTIIISGEGVYEVKVFNAMGQLVYEDPAYSSNSELNVNSKGVHVIQLLQNGRRGMLKVVMQ